MNWPAGSPGGRGVVSWSRQQGHLAGVLYISSNCYAPICSSGPRVPAAKGRRIGRPSEVDSNKLAYATHLRDAGDTIAEIVAKTGIARTTLYRHLLSRPPEPITAPSAAPMSDSTRSSPR